MDDTDTCPCGSLGGETFGVHCKGKEEHFVIPDSERDDGVLVPAFSVFRGDTAAIVFPEKTFCLFVHPLMDMLSVG